MKATANTPIIKDLGQGIKTTIPLVRISGSHFRMVDEDENENNKHKDRVSGGQPHGTGVGTIAPPFQTIFGDNDDGMDYEVNAGLSGHDPRMENTSSSPEKAHEAMQT